MPVARSNGPHFVWPWARTTELNDAIQSEDFRDANCVTVRLANQSKACVTTVLRWQMKPSAAMELFQDYKETDNIRTSLVENNFKVDMNEVFRSYDPLMALANGNTDASATAPDPLIQMGQAVQKSLTQQIGGQIDVLGVSVSVVNYDQGTEAKITQYQEALTATRIAQQDQKTAAAQAAANQTLASSVANNPYVLVSRCLDLESQMIQKGQSIPAGYSCWPGNNAGVLVSNK